MNQLFTCAKFKYLSSSVLCNRLRNLFYHSCTTSNTLCTCFCTTINIRRVCMVRNLAHTHKQNLIILYLRILYTLLLTSSIPSGILQHRSIPIGIRFLYPYSHRATPAVFPSEYSCVGVFRWEYVFGIPVKILQG